MTYDPQAKVLQQLTYLTAVVVDLSKDQKLIAQAVDKVRKDIQRRVDGPVAWKNERARLRASLCRLKAENRKLNQALDKQFPLA